ncbi:hypothetical protein [Micromonospora sp. WMMD1082]|uniref:hypothetical protein n=1 Tax=Micromonospora sp. WMMD1082 TaxID=3016104 RepID=UPI0024162C5F|nr:hypothetical protein [Micromonospora sp. WMMD1082]MDG4796197.1 hypothetical protein [Micromonospora sp. WMMD1082]
MARIRTIKPDFFTSLTIADLSLHARLTFIGLWTHVDDSGRCVDDARLIKAAVWPLDDRVSADVERDLRELSEASLIVRYEVGGRGYLAVRTWDEHQRINRPTKSKLPEPPSAPPAPRPPGRKPRSEESRPAEAASAPGRGDSSVTTHQPLTEDSPQERKGKERKGKEGNREGKGTPPTAGRSLALAAPPTLALVEPPADPPATTQALVAEWIDHCRKRPPGNVIGQVSKHIKTMLAEGTDPADIRRGFAEWARKGLHPSTLPSVVNEVMNSGTHPPAQKLSTADQRFSDAMALAARLAQEEAS